MSLPDVIDSTVNAGQGIFKDGLVRLRNINEPDAQVPGYGSANTNSASPRATRSVGAGGSVTSWEERSVARGCGHEGLRGSGADEHVIGLAEVMAQAHEHGGEAGHTRERVLEVRARFAGQVGNHEVDRMVERNLQDVF